MHVLFVTQYFYPEVGATQTRILEFARECRRHGHQVTILTEMPNHPHGRIAPEYRGRLVARDVFDGLDVLRVWVWTRPKKTIATRLAFYASFSAMAAVCGAVLPKRADVVFATSPPLSVGLIGWALARIHRARFVLDVRDLWPAVLDAVIDVPRPGAMRAAEALERFLYRSADTITTVTRGFVRHIRQRVKDPGRVFLVPNGAATKLFDPDRQDPGLRERLGLDGQFVVTFAGLHGLAQGLDTVVAAAGRLYERRDIVFQFIGDGPSKAALVAQSEALGLTNVRFLPMMPADEVVPHLVASDALLVPLKSHPVFDAFVPSKLYEYMSCARPVILSVDGEAREILEAASGGVFCRAGDVTALAESIVRMSELSNEERSRIGARGRAYVVANYSRASQAAHLRDLLESNHAQQTPQPAAHGPTLSR